MKKVVVAITKTRSSYFPPRPKQCAPYEKRDKTLSLVFVQTAIVWHGKRKPKKCCLDCCLRLRTSFFSRCFRILTDPDPLPEVRYALDIWFWKFEHFGLNRPCGILHSAGVIFIFTFTCRSSCSPSEFMIYCCRSQGGVFQSCKNVFALHPRMHQARCTKWRSCSTHNQSTELCRHLVV